MSPTRPRRACRAPGCPSLVASGYCATHAHLEPIGWARPSRASAFRTTGRRWRRLRAEVLYDEPHCYLCGTFAHDDDVVDHVRPLAAGGTDARENLRRCCRTCHTEKTSRESVEARR